jgi:hypothetical protein
VDLLFFFVHFILYCWLGKWALWPTSTAIREKAYIYFHVTWWVTETKCEIMDWRNYSILNLGLYWNDQYGEELMKLAYCANIKLIRKIKE